MKSKLFLEYSKLKIVDTQDDLRLFALNTGYCLNTGSQYTTMKEISHGRNKLE